MSVEYLFRRFGQKTGLRALEDNERQQIADYVNEAAKAIYEQSEIPELLKELTVTTTAEQILVLPVTVGDVRAMRESTGLWPWTMRDAYSKYQYGVQHAGLWFSWMVKGHRALAITNYAISGGDLTIDAQGIDANLAVTITGSTATQTKKILTVNPANVSLVHPNPFTSIDSITKNMQTTYDVLVTDSILGQIAKIPNNQKEARYLWVDVSKYPSASSIGSLNMDVLYKEAYQYLYNDADIFADNNYDDVILERALSNWCEDNNQPENAILHDRKSERELGRKMDNSTRGEVEMAKFVPNDYDTLIPRAYTFRNRARIRRGSYGH